MVAMTWHGEESDDAAQCLDCGQRVDGPKYGPQAGVFQCWGCALGEAREVKPLCLRCHEPAEGALCAQCEHHVKAHRERVLRKFDASVRRMRERARGVAGRFSEEA